MTLFDTLRILVTIEMIAIAVVAAVTLVRVAQIVWRR